MRHCFYFGTITNTAAGDWFINDPRSRVAGSGSPVFDFGTSVGNTNLNIRGNSGGWQLEAMGNTGTDKASIEGWGQVIEGTCTGGAVTVRGNFTTSGITNLTLSDDARFDSVQLVDDIYDEAESGHNIGGSFGKGFRQTKEGTISAESTVNDAGASTTVFITALTEDTDNHYIDVSVVFIDGALKGQSRPVLSYNGTTKAITLDEALTEAPGDGDGFIIKTDHVHPVTQIQAGLATETKQDTAKTVIDLIKIDTASGGVPKNAAFNDFQFPMVLTSDHYTAATGKSVTGQRSVNGGAWANITGSISEVGSGLYTADLSAADTNGDTVSYKFSATDCDDTMTPTIITRS
jgi:hypothetical protein